MQKLVNLYDTIECAEEFGNIVPGIELEESKWEEQAKLKIGRFTWHTLFLGCGTVSLTLRDGFQCVV